LNRQPGPRDDDPEAARSAALGVLARSDRLPGLIERANEELKKTPNAVQVHRTLADYCTAARRRDQARAELMKILALRPDDAPVRLQVANQLVQAGQTAAALEHYQAAFRIEPDLLGRSFPQIQAAFQQAGKNAELLRLLESVDFRSLGPFPLARLL